MISPLNLSKIGTEFFEGKFRLGRKDDFAFSVSCRGLFSELHRR